MEDTQATIENATAANHGMMSHQALNGNSNFDAHRTGESASKSAPETLAPKGYLPFVEARKFATSLNLSTRKEWRSYVKGEIAGTPPKPANVPAHPDGIYKVKGWQGWKYWLGTVEASASTTTQQ